MGKKLQEAPGLIQQAVEMKIGIDISRSIEDATGVGYYAKNLVHALADIDSVNEYIMYSTFFDCFPAKWKDAKIPSNSNFNLHQRNLPSWYIRKAWQDAGHREHLFRGVDIVHSTAFTMPPVSGPKVIVTIHDLSFLVFPQHHTDANYQFVNRNVHMASRRADHIIADSESTRNDIKRFLHVPDEKISVVHLAAKKIFCEKRSSANIAGVRSLYGINKPYLLAVGSIEPRKNLALSLIAFKALIEITGAGYQFVIAGGAGWKNEAFYSLLKRLDINEHLVFTGYVAEKDLPALYQGADVFVYPSVYEGFGLPVLEAMASGVPVITSNTSSLPEVAGNAALLVNPLEAVEIFEAMETLLTRPELREELKTKGFKQSRKFSWEMTARKTFEIYQKVMNEN
jgi:glycosyltransferase involved in cell wall biosynthesis